MSFSCLLDTIERMINLSAPRPLARLCIPVASLSFLIACISSPAVATPVALAPVAASDERAPTVETFDIWEFEVEGNSVLPAGMVEKAIEPFLGPGKTLKDLEGARASLEKLYQDAGYLSVLVDDRDMRADEQGVVRLQVIEGTIARVKVVGARHHDPAYVRDKVPELSPGRAPNFKVVQLQLADVNRTEQRRVQPVIQPGRTPGTVDIELQVTDESPITFNAELNNRQGQFTEPWRLQVGMRHNNLWQADHALAITAITSHRTPARARCCP